MNGLKVEPELLIKLAYGGTEVKLAIKALGFLGRNLSKVGKLTRFFGRRVKQISKAEEAAERTAKIARSERISTKAGHELNQFDRAASELSQVGKDNIRTLRGWARSKGWIPKPNIKGGPEVWGIHNADGTFRWNIKIKPIDSVREGIQPGSQIPRFSCRVKEGVYINPFTVEKGGVEVGGHLPLDIKYF